jgi:uncharacterized protein YqhQ
VNIYVQPIFPTVVAKVLVEGFFKLILLISYIYFVSLTLDKREEETLYSMETKEFV